MKKRPQSRPKPVIPDESVKGTNALPEMSHTRGKIRLKFGRLNVHPSSSNPNLSSRNPVLPDRVCPLHINILNFSFSVTKQRSNVLNAQFLMLILL